MKPLFFNSWFMREKSFNFTFSFNAGNGLIFFEGTDFLIQMVCVCVFFFFYFISFAQRHVLKPVKLPGGWSTHIKLYVFGCITNNMPAQVHIGSMNGKCMQPKTFCLLHGKYTHF